MATVRCDHLFDLAPEKRGGTDESTTVHVEHFFRDGDLQLMDGVVGRVVDRCLNHAPNGIIQRLPVRGAVVREVLETPCVRLPRLVSRRRVVLEEVVVSTRHTVHPWLDNRREDVDVGVGVDCQALWKKSGGIMCPSRRRRTPRAITEEGHLVCITVEASEGLHRATCRSVCSLFDVESNVYGRRAIEVIRHCPSSSR